MTIKVKSCKQCPFYSNEREQGFTLEICSHPERNTYDYSLKDKYVIPDFCPLIDESVEIELDW